MGSLVANSFRPICLWLVYDYFSKFFPAFYLVKFGQLGTGVHTNTRTWYLARSYTPPFLNDETKCNAYLNTYVCARARTYLLVGTSVYRPANTIDTYVGIVRYECVDNPGQNNINKLAIIVFNY